MNMDKELYEMIRAGAGYRAVMVITPPGVLPEQTPEAHCFVRAEWRLGMDREPNAWHPVSALEASLIFNGSSGAGWGFADLPRRTFDSLEEVSKWVEARKPKAA
jgi:hypothetical protein